MDRALSYILLQELPREHDALLLHGVATVRRGWGLAHSGRSGVGKTTTARLAAGYADVLVDENLVISLTGPQPTLLSTPFWGGSTPLELIRRVNRQAPLRALLLPEHGPDFVLEPLSHGDAVLALLTTEKVAVERVSSAAAWLAAAERLVAQVPTYRSLLPPHRGAVALFGRGVGSVCSRPATSRTNNCGGQHPLSCQPRRGGLQWDSTKPGSPPTKIPFLPRNVISEHALRLEAACGDTQGTHSPRGRQPRQRHPEGRQLHQPPGRSDC